MANALYRLVYVSENSVSHNARAVGGEEMLQAEIEQILAASRRNNVRVDVTGALMFNTGCFAQVLEGPQEAVQDTFERIQCDMRHRKVAVLAFEPTDERRFAQWSMAYVGHETSAQQQFEHLARESGFNAAELDGDHVLALLQQHLQEAEA